MTVHEFITALSECREFFEWRIAPPKMMSTPRDIRGADSGCTDYCPVTAVCRHMTGVIYSTGGFRTAGHEIGLTYSDAETIAAAADSSRKELVYRKRDLTELRQSLLEAVGLA